MAQANNSDAASDSVLRELAAIKRLLILQLITSGVKAQDVAKVLGTSNSTISRLVPARLVRNSKG